MREQVQRQLMLAMLVTVPLAATASMRDRPDPTLAISPERLSYRLVQRDSYYVATVVVRLRNQSGDTVYLATECGMGYALYRQWEQVSSGSEIQVPGWLEGCALSGDANRGPLDRTIAIPPDGSRRDTVVAGAKAYLPRGVTAPREGVLRVRVRYTPLVQRGFLRKKWTIDRHVWLSSDPFELLTPGFER